MPREIKNISLLSFKNKSGFSGNVLKKKHNETVNYFFSFYNL